LDPVGYCGTHWEHLYEAKKGEDGRSGEKVKTAVMKNNFVKREKKEQDKRRLVSRGG